jgi:hypothetical protein
MKRIALIALSLLVVSGCALLDADESDRSVTVGTAVASIQIGDDVHLHGEVSLLGELFCPCFHVSDGEATVVVWYDLMVDDAGEFPAVDVEGIDNGDEVVVAGEYRSTDPGTGYPVIWAEEVNPR